VASRLDVYELDHREPIGYVDREGMLRLPDGSRAGSAGLTWPLVLFADVPVLLHLSCGHSLAPFAKANADTGSARSLRYA